MKNEFTDDEKSGFYKAIFSRRDVRSKFTSQAIDESVLNLTNFITKNFEII